MEQPNKQFPLELYGHPSLVQNRRSSQRKGRSGQKGVQFWP